MCVTKCERHPGYQFTFAVCEHVADGIARVEPTIMYVQSLAGACHQFGLCEACIRMNVPEPLDAASELICVTCVREWSDATGANLAARCEPGMEFPVGMHPWSYSAPSTAVSVNNGVFLFDDQWRVVTRTGAWPVPAYPQGCLHILELSWSDVLNQLTIPGAPPFPLDSVIERALLDMGPYWAERALSYLFDGFPLSRRLQAAATRVRLPPTRAAEVARKLGELRTSDESS